MEPTSIPSGPPPQRARPRELGVRIGIMPPGPTSSIIDVPGVAVGHRTVWRDEPKPPDGRGVARTGVTAIVPFGGYALMRDPVPAGVAVLNGAGAAIGRTAIEEWGVLETPIFLTTSMAIGRVYDAAVGVLMASELVGARGEPIMPVVAECDDGFLNERFPIQLDAADVEAAFAAAEAGAFAAPAGAEGGSPVAAGVVGVASGVVGAGTGMRAFGLKGGIGTASRRVAPSHRWAAIPAPPGADAYTVGVLVLANYGEIGRLTIDGVRVGETLLAEGWPAAGIPARLGAGDVPLPSAARGADGSCIAVVATDAPLTAHQLRRLAQRAGLGLGRTGSIAHHGSGEIFLAFSTGLRIGRGSTRALRSMTIVDDEYLDPIFGAVVEATEEAAIDALFTADTVCGRDGHVVPGLPVERTLELLRAAGRLADGR